MIIKALSFVSILLPLAVSAAMTWYPAPDWKESPDPVASPRAKRGGTIRFNGAQGPKSYNGYIDNNAYTRMTFDLMYDCLISTERDTLEFAPALARRWGISDDGRKFEFELDERAKWSDGRPITAEDVKWTFDSVVSPTNDTGVWKTVLGAFESPVIESPRRFSIRKKGDSPKDWRDLMNCAFFPVLPKHAFDGLDFAKLDFENAPVSGPYRLSRINEQVSAEFTRAPFWWREGSPSVRGTCNFERIVVKYYADNENAFEAFKKRAIDVYPVYSARIMAEGTKGESFAKNHILKRRVRNYRPIGFQGFALNMRRAPFDDLKVRQAMAKLIDRETMNRTMMNGEYFLLKSYYTDLYDEKNPCPNRLWEYDPKGAAELLAQAGWKRGVDGMLVKDGRKFTFTFLSRSAGEDKFLALVDHALREQGIEMKIDRKDFAGWMRDMDSFNFDMTWAAWGASVFRMPETMWHSREGKNRGGNNITGFASPEVDRLIEAEKSMMAQADRIKAYREIDRLIAAELPYILLWHTDEQRILYWNKFGMPSTVLGRYDYEEGVLSYWWYDEDRARELKAAVNDAMCLPDVPVKVDFDKAVNK